MSYYTKFADVESLLTSTTTTVLGSTDSLLVFSATDGKYHVTTVGAVGLVGPSLQTLTSASTATNIVPGGLTIIQSSNALSYLLTQAPGPGFTKTITSSTTAVITIVCSLATLSSSEALNGTQVIMGSAGAFYPGGITLVSVGTSPSTRWLLTSRSTGLTLAS